MLLLADLFPLTCKPSDCKLRLSSPTSLSNCHDINRLPWHKQIRPCLLPVRIFSERAKPLFQCLGGVGCNIAVHSIASVMLVMNGSLLLIAELQLIMVTFQHTCDTVLRATCILPRLGTEFRHACRVSLQI